MMITVFIFLSFVLISNLYAGPVADKYYLRIEKSRESDKNDLDIVSIGMLAIKQNMAGHVELNRVESISNGDSLLLNFGGGYAFNWDVSWYLSLGISLGYNQDTEDLIAAYYPETGIVLDLTKTFGITASAKRFYHLYNQDEDVVMLGLVFRE